MAALHGEGLHDRLSTTVGLGAAPARQVKPGKGSLESIYLGSYDIGNGYESVLFRERSEGSRKRR